MKLITSSCQICELEQGAENCQGCPYKDDTFYSFDSRYFHIHYVVEDSAGREWFLYIRILGLWIRLSSAGNMWWIEPGDKEGLGDMFPASGIKTEEEE